MTVKELKKILRVKIFSTPYDLCRFVNSNCITQENIQTITTVSVDNSVCHTLYYWEFEE